MDISAPRDDVFFYTSGVPTGCHGTCSLKHLLTSRDSHISYYLCLSSLLAGSIKCHPTTFPCHLCHGRYWWSLALQTAFFKLSCSVDSFQVRFFIYNFVTSLSAFIHSMCALSPIMNPLVQRNGFSHFDWVILGFQLLTSSSLVMELGYGASQ